MRAVQVTEYGGPEVLQVVDLPDPEPSPGLISVSASGVNYADTHQVENSYLSSKKPPFVPGMEVVGTDPDGRRVLAFVDGGGYAQKAVAHPALTFPLPDEVGDHAALALAVQGATAWLMLHDVAHLKKGDWVGVHAAAGGVGTLAVQLAKAAGANVVACASTPEKRALAESLGADVTVDPAEPGLTAALKDATGGHGLDIVLEMTGGKVTNQSVDALAPFGRLIFYGLASRQPPANVSPLRLMANSTAIMGFWLVHSFARREAFSQAMNDLISTTATGTLKPVLGGTYALADARQAHEDMRARLTTGKVVLDSAGAA